MNVNKTREAILDNSIVIFNEKKATKVSTVQIADFMGISPGNLYYYFRNKEEIIRCLWFERIRRELQNTIPKFSDLDSGEQIVDLLMNLTEPIRASKFFYQEISTLIHNDDELRDAMKESKRNNDRALFRFIETLIGNGLIQSISMEEKIRLADAICCIVGKAFYSNYAYSFYYEMNGRMKKVFLTNMVMTISPYLTEKCWDGIRNGLQTYDIDYHENAKILEAQYIS